MRFRPIRCRRYRPRALRRSSTGLQANAYTISPGDALLITSYYYPQLKQTVAIQPDGRASLLLVGEVIAEGKTPGG